MYKKLLLINKEVPFTYIDSKIDISNSQTHVTKLQQLLHNDGNNCRFEGFVQKITKIRCENVPKSCKHIAPRGKDYAQISPD